MNLNKINFKFETDTHIEKIKYGSMYCGPIAHLLLLLTNVFPLGYEPKITHTHTQQQQIKNKINIALQLR